MKKFNYIVIILCVLSLSGYAQSPSISNDSLSWKVTGFYNSSNQETLNIVSEFITYGSTSITWVQDKGSKMYEFSIKELQGSWNDVDKDGEVTYSVLLNGTDGKLKFQRINGTVKIFMEFINDGENVMPYIFSISQIAKR